MIDILDASIVIGAYGTGNAQLPLERYYGPSVFPAVLQLSPDKLAEYSILGFELLSFGGEKRRVIS